MKIIIIFCLMGLYFHPVFSQNVPQLQHLREYAMHNEPPGFQSSSKYINLYKGHSIHYLNPLYQLFKEEKRFINQLKPGRYYEELSQALSLLEDYQSSLQYAIKAYDTLSLGDQKKIIKTVRELKSVEHVDARKYISFVAKAHPVIMFNEAPDKPLHRVFVLSLLPELYKKGFRYLALEMLNNSSGHSWNRPGAETGYYSSEPIAGELIRYAQEIGFTLISYEDTLAYLHTPNQRDSIQAVNLYKVIQRDTSAKILVMAGYAHIAKHSLDGDYIPMAMSFKRVSGIDPFSIDQTDMTEEGNMEWGRMLYREYMGKYALSTASIALINNEPVNITNNDDYDLAIIHPPTTYRDGRPSWLDLAGLRQPTYIKPADKATFLIQAYYQNEMPATGPDGLVPADQTYIPTNRGNYLLFLRKGKYVVVFRGIDYRILGKLNIEVS